MNTASTGKKSDTQTEKCLHEIRRRIIAGHWPAASKLREVPLAETLGVSRTPLRSALLQLEQEGLLERIGGGYTVRAFSIRDAIVAIELRGLIEGTAARLAAESQGVVAHMADIRQTLGLLDEVVQQQFVEGYSDLNTLFHEQLASLAASDLIRDEVRRASRLPFAAPSAFSSTRSDLERFKSSMIVGQQHHHALLESIARGEGARAEALAREHAHLAVINIEVAYREREESQVSMPALALVAS